MKTKTQITPTEIEIANICEACGLTLPYEGQDLSQWLCGALAHTGERASREQTTWSVQAYHNLVDFAQTKLRW